MSTHGRSSSHLIQPTKNSKILQIDSRSASSALSQSLLSEFKTSFPLLAPSQVVNSLINSLTLSRAYCSSLPLFGSLWATWGCSETVLALSRCFGSSYLVTVSALSRCYGSYLVISKLVFSLAYESFAEICYNFFNQCTCDVLLLLMAIKIKLNVILGCSYCMNFTYM